MRLLIAGATGQVGTLVVQTALALGHDVTAMARDPRRLGETSWGQNPRLRLHAGDVLDHAAVERAVPDCEAVVLVFGAPLNWQTFTRVPTLRAEATRHFIDSMNRSGVRRLVVMTGIGSGDSRPSGRPLFRYIIRPFLLGRIYVDMERQEEIVKASSLDWTIVRAAELTNEQHEGKVRKVTSYADEKAGTIGRPDVARFLVSCCTDATLIRQSLVITS